MIGRLGSLHVYRGEAENESMSPSFVVFIGAMGGVDGRACVSARCVTIHPRNQLSDGQCMDVSTCVHRLAAQQNLTSCRDTGKLVRHADIYLQVDNGVEDTSVLEH